MSDSQHVGCSSTTPSPQNNDDQSLSIDSSNCGVWVPGPTHSQATEPYCGCSAHSETISLSSSAPLTLNEYETERWKTILTFLIFLLTLLLNHLVLAIISDIISREPLPDLFHSLFTQTPMSRHLADIFASAGCLFTFLLVCILHKYRWIVSRRLFYIGSVLYIMRAISICVTHIPAGYTDNFEVCVPPSENPNPPFSKVFSNFAHIFITMGLQVKDDNGRLYCGDMLFSGHTTALSTCCFFLNHYMPHSLWPIKLAVISLCGVGMFCLVISGAHYSVDVIMGYWISSSMFSIYHAFCDIPHESRPRSRAFRRLFMFWSMFEEERRVPAGRLPNHLQWPLPWPKPAVEFFENWNEQKTGTTSGSIARWLAEHRIKLHM